MKKLFYSFLLSFLIQQFVFSQQGWVNQNSGTNAELLSVFFLDHSNGLASGAIGTLIRTTDGGLNWTTQNSGTTAWLNSIFFLDQNYGWIVGPKWNGVSDIGHLLITTDGGINWTLSTTSMPLYEVIFNNQNIGNAIGNQYPGNIGKIAKTSDGGASWVQKASGPYSSHFWDMCFINDSTGWVVGATDLSSQGIILKTTDRGENWIDQPINTSVYFTSVKFVDSNIGWIVGAQGTIIKTTNNGADWIEKLSGTG